MVRFPILYHLPVYTLEGAFVLTPQLTVLQRDPPQSATNADVCVMCSSPPPPLSGMDSLSELSLSRARLGELGATEGELRVRLAAAEAAASEQGGLLSSAEAERDELRDRLVESEAAASELRVANEALARELAVLKKEHAELRGSHAAALFDWRPRDFGAELPAAVLLNIMDHAPDGRCVNVRLI